MRILEQAPETDFGVVELALHDPERMLDFRPHARFGPILYPLPVAQPAMAAAFLLREVTRFRGAAFQGGFLTGIGRIAVDQGLFPMQQVFEHLAVVHVGGCGRDRVDELTLAVDANVRFHAEVPLVALPGLMHLRVSGFF